MKNVKLSLVLVFLAALAACKQEPEFSADPHAALVNPFTGIWRVDGAGFRRFRTDGTGGDGASAAGPFGGDFSFLVYAGQDAQTVPASGTLVTVSGNTAAEAEIRVYGFTVSDSAITLSAQEGGTSAVLERVSGGPEALALSNPFIGEWTAEWDAGEHGLSWSWKYRADGTAKTLHHEVGHQFENSYITRGDVLVQFGYLRFGYNNQPVFGDFTLEGENRIIIAERQGHISPAAWVYTRVSSAPWL